MIIRKSKVAKKSTSFQLDVSVEKNRFVFRVIKLFDNICHWFLEIV